MLRPHYELLVLSALLASCCTANQGSVNNDLVVTNVRRTIDLTTHLVKVTNDISLENGGSSAVTSFLFAVDASLTDNLAFIGAQTKVGDEEQKLSVAETTVSSLKGKTFYQVHLPSSLGAGKQVTVDVEMMYSHALQPYPQQITQAEKQFMRFDGNLYFYSPYHTKSQITVVNCATNNIESYTKTSPVAVSDTTVTYGPFQERQAFTEAKLSVHYENNAPFLTVTSMERVVEVSHWGNIAVEETLDLLHTGATLKGPFSRYDYQRNQDGVSSIKSFKTVLPSSARDVYYRDEIGNISTSHLRENDDSVEIELRPRFPLFGGWKTHYYVGYNVPSYQYLYNQDDKFVLKMRFVDHVYDDQAIDDLTLKVILPEGARDIELVTPFKVERSKNQLHYTYLDTMGRPVVIAHKANLVENHIQDFELHYTFPKMMLLQEPFLVVGAFYLLFMIVIIYVRLDFSITKDEASESRMRIGSLVEQVQGAQDRRSALYQSYEDAVNKFKSSKDNTSFMAQRKKIDADHRQLTQEIAGFLAKLKTEGSDIADKVSDLQRLDSQIRDQINQGIQAAEKLVAQKMAKQQYLDLEKATSAKRDEIYQKMENILTAM